MRFMIVALSSALLFGGTAFAAPCKDAKGKFTACPKPAAAATNKCKDAKGRFAKCSAPGAVPR